MKIVFSCFLYPSLSIQLFHLAALSRDGGRQTTMVLVSCWVPAKMVPMCWHERSKRRALNRESLLRWRILVWGPYCRGMRPLIDFLMGHGIMATNCNCLESDVLVFWLGLHICFLLICAISSMFFSFQLSLKNMLVVYMGKNYMLSSIRTVTQGYCTSWEGFQAKLGLWKYRA